MKLVDRLVCGLIRWQLGGQDVVLQRAGADWDENSSRASGRCS